MARVLVLGGGFGGLAGAHELRRLLGDGDEVVVVDRSDRFYMGFAKLWDLAGVRPLEQGTASRRRLPDRGIDFVEADITAIDPSTRRVETSAGDLRGDALLVALGAGPSPAHTAMLAGDHAHDLYDGDQLPAMHRDLDAVDGGQVLVSLFGGPFKCPPAPYEAVLLVDEHLRHRRVRDDVAVSLSTPQPMTLPVAGIDASRYVADHLAERGVELLSEHAVTAVDGDRRVVQFGNGAEVEYRVLLGVPANVPPPVVADSGLLGPSGWIEPDRHTLRTAVEGVYAVGDCTMVPTAGGQLPKAGVFAAAEAEVAARNIAAELHGGDGAAFDGHGHCFLELPGQRVAMVEGDFYAEPSPDVTLIPADREHYRRKQAYERDRLAAWLG